MAKMLDAKAERNRAKCMKLCVCVVLWPLSFCWRWRRCAHLARLSHTIHINIVDVDLFSATHAGGLSRILPPKIFFFAATNKRLLLHQRAHDACESNSRRSNYGQQIK